MDLIIVNEKWAWVGSFAFSIFTILFGAWDLALKTLLTFIVLDYITGIIKAWLTDKISSSKGYQGIIKKSLILIVIIVANMTDSILNTNGLFRNAICYIYVSIEAISILENLAACGVPIPQPIIDKLVQLRKSAEDNLK